MLKKLLIIMMIALSSMHLFDVQANTTVLSQLPEAIQQRLYERLNNQEDDAITETKLTASDGASNDYFGQEIFIDGTTLVVSSRYDDDNGNDSGSVYVYDLTKNSGDTGFERKIISSDGVASDHFGRSVALDGTTLVVSAHFDDDNGVQSGSVYVYDLTKNSGDNGFERKITASDGATKDYFGHQIALDESTLVVSSHHDDDNGEGSGSVYVYDLTKTNADAGFERKIIASDGAASDNFGFSIEIQGTTLVVGAPKNDGNTSDSGSVYVYDLTKNNGDAGFERKISASDAEVDARFGNSVAIDGTTLVVGSRLDDVNGTETGSVYVYDLTKNNGDAGFENKITASDGASNDNFGYSVALYGSTLVVGANLDDDKGTNSGSVYVYDLTKNSGDDGFETKITASDGASDDNFGVFVAFDGSTLFVGARLDDDNGSGSGSVYIYNGTFGSGNTDTEDPITETKLTASDGALNDYFGESIAIDGTTLVVGASREGGNGAVYVYDLTKDSNEVGFERKITASDGASNDIFGKSVAINGTTLVVGSDSDDDNAVNSGSVYVYDLTKTPEDDGFETKITASDGAIYDYFGYTVSIQNTTVVVGTYNADTVYVYDLNKSSSDEGFETKITSSTGGNDKFGYSVDLEGTTLVVGSSWDDDKGSDSGSVYVYDLTKTSEDDGFERKITAFDGSSSDYFGSSVAIDGTTLIVGSSWDDNEKGSNSGSVYVYELTKTPEDNGFETKITASDGTSNDYFGYSVAIDGDTILVTSYGDDDKGTNSGSVYVYDLTKNSGDDGFETKITASDGATDDKFGFSGALNGTTLVVSTHFDDDNGTDSGSVYIYSGTFGSGTTKTDEEWASEITTMIDAFTDPLVVLDVEAARTAYDALTEAQQALVTNYQVLLDAEQTLTDIAAAAEVDVMIDAFTDPLVSDDVAAAREAYNNLTADQQALVTNYQTLLDAEQALIDIDAAAAVDALIDAFTDPLVALDVEAARTAYDALTEAQQALVTNYQVLLDAEQTLTDIAAAAEVDALIDAFTDPLVSDDVAAAREAYNNLTETQQALVTGLLDLEAAEQTLADIAAAAAVDVMIDAFTDPLVSDDVAAAREAYNNLTADQQALVTNYQVLLDAEQTLTDIAAAAEVDVMIDAFTDPLVSDDVAAAREAYNNLTETQQALVTNYQVLLDAEQTLTDIAAAAEVDVMIDAFTDPLVSDDVAAAREAYNNLTETQQALVTGLLDLEAAEQTLTDIAAAAEVDAMIDALTSPYEATDVKDAREAYDNLTEAQQALVTGLTQLEIAEAELNDQLNAQAAAEVDALIQTLTEEATEEDVEAAREAYDALTPDQQALVTELPTLETYERQVEPSSIFGSLLIILIVIAGISAVVYFGFYKRDRKEKQPVAPVVAPSKVEKEDTVSKAFMKKKLLELRETLIKKYDYAEFFIYTDEQLDLLIEHQPKTKAEFIKVKGFGEKKYKNFGKEVVQLFKTYKLK